MKRGQVFLIFIIVAVVALVALFFLFKASATGAPALRLPSQALPLGPKSLPETIPGPQLPNTGLTTLHCVCKAAASIDWTCSKEIPPALLSGKYGSEVKYKYCNSLIDEGWSMTVPGVVVEAEKKDSVCSNNIPQICQEAKSTAISNAKNCIKVIKQVCMGEDVKGSFTSYPIESNIVSYAT
jgi:hypothetical protein